MNKKGQALVEFVLIFPVFIIIVCTIIELGSINYQKLKLESDLDTVVNMYLKDENYNNYLKNNNLKIDLENESNQVTVKLSKNVKIVTPVLKLIYSSNQKIETERVFYDE